MKRCLLQIAELRCESAQCFADGAGADFGGVALAGVNPERGRNHDFHCHLLRSNRSWNSKSKLRLVASSRGLVARGLPKFYIPSAAKAAFSRSFTARLKSCSAALLLSVRSRSCFDQSWCGLRGGVFAANF